MIPNDFWKQQLFPLCRLGRILETPNTFFFEISKCCTGRNSQYFLTGPGLIKRKSYFAIMYKPTFDDFGPGGPEDPDCLKSLSFSGEKSK